VQGHGKGDRRSCRTEGDPTDEGLRELPLKAVLVGVIEELFFRGVLLPGFDAKAPGRSIIGGDHRRSARFCFQQLVQIRIAFQAIAIGSKCVEISPTGVFWWC
jgi:hypothetical protein